MAASEGARRLRLNISAQLGDQAPRSRVSSLGSALLLLVKKDGPRP